MGRGTSKTGKTKIQSRDEYLGERGLASPLSDFMVDKQKIPHGLTQRQRKAFEKDAATAAAQYQERRAAAIQEYNSLVDSGKIQAPTAIQKMLKTAKGHADNPSVQAARRALEKRGYDWQTGRKKKK